MDGNFDGWIPVNEAWTYASADDPTFTFTVSGDKTNKYWPGMKLKLMQTSVKYFIVTKISYSAPDTTVTVYGGVDYDLANAAIETPYYSSVKVPFGFPLDPTKWTVSLADSSNLTQSSPTAGTWYNLGSLLIEVPIGVWNVSYELLTYAVRTTGPLALDQYVTLSTANSTESDIEFTFNLYGLSWEQSETLAAKSKILNLTSKTTYYLNSKTTQTGVNSIAFIGTQSPTIIKAVCSYL